MRFVPILIVLFFGASLAQADDGVQMKKFCETLPQYQKSKGAQSPDYQAGVDAHGRAVVPADLSPPLPVIDPITIPITVNLAQRYGLDLPQDVELKPEVAYIAVYQDGRIVYNGVDISKQSYTACDHLLKTENTPSKQHGQDAELGLSSPDTGQDKDGGLIQGQYPE